MSGNNETPKSKRYELCEFQIIARGITQKCQPIDMILAQILKGYYREDCDLYMFTASENNKGKPMPPINQIYEQWVVKAWDTVPE